MKKGVKRKPALKLDEHISFWMNCVLHYTTTHTHTALYYCITREVYLPKLQAMYFKIQKYTFASKK